jgi:hypothetical protein
MSSRRAVLALVLGGAFSGCLGVVPFQPRAYDDAVRVEAVDLAFTKDGAGHLDLRLAVRNPSSDAATLTRVDFELRVDGRRFAVGEQGVAVPLDPDGKVPLEVRFPLASQRATGTPDDVEHRVELRGGVLLRFGGTERRAPFQDTRVLRLPWAPLAEPDPDA